MKLKFNQSIKAKLIKHLNYWWWLYAYLAVYSVVAGLVISHRFLQFEIFYFDHGIFDHNLWKFAHGHLPFFDHKQILQLHQLSDHFNPSFYLLTPIFWITDSYLAFLLTGLVSVVVSVCVMARVMHLWKVSRPMILALSIAYTLFIGLQNALLGGIHPEIYALTTLALAIYGLETKRWWLMWLMLVLTLGWKESAAPVVIGFGMLLLWKREFKRGILAIGLSLIWYLTATRVIIPEVFNRDYDYKIWPYATYSDLIKRMFEPYKKLEVYWTSFATFGLLPLLFVGTLPLLGQDFFIRFALTPGEGAWDLGMHYNLFLSIILLISSAYGVKYLRKFSWYKPKLEYVQAVMIILVALGLHLKIHRGPLQLAFNPAFYQNTKNNQFIHDWLDQVPETGTVMSMNHLIPHLTHRQSIYMNKFTYKAFEPDYILIDLRPGQNGNNFWPLNEGSTKELVQVLLADPEYQVEVSGDHQYFFSKISPNQSAN